MICLKYRFVKTFEFNFNYGTLLSVDSDSLTGIFFLMFGLGFLVDSFSLIFIFTPLFILVNTWELKMIEEPELLKRLGKKYDEYRNKTPMFIPGIRFKLKR